MVSIQQKENQVYNWRPDLKKRNSKKLKNLKIISFLQILKCLKRFQILDMLPNYQKQILLKMEEIVQQKPTDIVVLLSSYNKKVLPSPWDLPIKIP